jgi:hypothetical protein
MTRQSSIQPGARLLNHIELAYAPGERPLARTLLEGLGFRVLDPQTDPIPANLGPAAGPYLIVYLDPANDDVIDNVIYVSEVGSDQWRFECALRTRIEEDEDLASLQRDFRSRFVDSPQAMTHFGVAYPSGEEIDRVMQELASNRELDGRISLTEVYRPGSPGSVDDRVIQGFVYTDVLSTGLLCGGQQIELQVRLDGV